MGRPFCCLDLYCRVWLNLVRSCAWFEVIETAMVTLVASCSCGRQYITFLIGVGCHSSVSSDPEFRELSLYIVPQRVKSLWLLVTVLSSQESVLESSTGGRGGTDILGLSCSFRYHVPVHRVCIEWAQWDCCLFCGRVFFLIPFLGCRDLPPVP